MTTVGLIRETLALASTTTETSERLSAAVRDAKRTVETISRAQESNSTLGPELLAAVGHMGEAIDAMTRAHDTLMAMFEVRAAQIIASIP